MDSGNFEDGERVLAHHRTEQQGQKVHQVAKIVLETTI